MKHIFSIILLSLMTMSVMAVQYPKKPYTGGGTTSHAPVTYQQQAGQKHGYVTPTTGGSSYSSSVTIVGATTPTSSSPSTSHGGPRKAIWEGGYFDEDEGPTNLGEGKPALDDWWLADDGKWYQWDGSEWLPMPDDNPGNPAPDTPLGSTWVMLLFAALFALSIRLRRRSQA